MVARVASVLGRVLLACAVTAAPLAGCTTIRQVPMNPITAETEDGAAERTDQHITGYTTTDAVYHEFEGWVRPAGSDSLLFTPTLRGTEANLMRSSTMAETDPSVPFVLARAQVMSVSERLGSPGKTTALVFAIGAVLCIGFFIAAKAVGDAMTWQN